MSGGLGGAWATLYVRVINLPGGAPAPILRPGPAGPVLLSGSGPGQGHADLRRPAQRLAPALVGLTYDAQWLIRDPFAPGGRVAVGHGADHGRVTAARE